MTRHLAFLLLALPSLASAQTLSPANGIFPMKLRAPGFISGGATPVQGSTLSHLRLVTGTGIEGGASFTVQQSSGGDANTVPVGVIGQARILGGTVSHSVGVLGWANNLSTDSPADQRTIEGRCDIRNPASGGVCMGVLGLTYLEGAVTNAGQFNYALVGLAQRLTGSATGTNVGVKASATGAGTNINAQLGDGSVSGDNGTVNIAGWSSRTSAAATVACSVSDTLHAFFCTAADPALDGFWYELRDTAGASSFTVFDSSFGIPFTVSSAGDLTAKSSILIGSGSKITGSTRCTATLGTSAIASNTTATQAITCANAAVNAECVVGGATTLEAGLIQTCYVSAAGTVTLRTHNGTVGSITPAAAQTISVRYFNP